MKLAYVTTYNTRTSQGSNEWSRTGSYIAQSLKNQAITLEYIDLLHDSLAWKTIRKLKRHYYQLVQQKNYQKDADPLTLKHYASQIAQKLKNSKSDMVFSATVNPIAYLECDRPIAFWQDGTFVNIASFYPQCNNLFFLHFHSWLKGGVNDSQN